MLILTRKRSEMIQIGEDIFIKVIRTGPTTVKIGIEAPSNVRILRGELCGDVRNAREGDVLDLDPPETDCTQMSYAFCSDQFPHPNFTEIA